MTTPSSFEHRITHAWQTQAKWLWLLLPLTWLYGMVMWLRKLAYQHSWFASYRAPVPVMVIGNITVGGSGKTPLIIALVNYLTQHQVKVGVISRGYSKYKDTTKPKPSAQQVTQYSRPDDVGDEPCLIVQQTGVPMAVGSNRQAAIELLLTQHPDIRLILADDGLQHLALQRDIEWIVVDSKRGFGNGQLLPTGFLREPINRLQTATVINHGDASQTLHMQLQPTELYGVNQPAEAKPPQAGEQIYAVSGIGYPQRFFTSLRDLGFNVIEKPFSDHHIYQPQELNFSAKLPIVTTAKDAVKLAPLGVACWVLPVSAVMSKGCYQLLAQQLAQLNIILK